MLDRDLFLKDAREIEAIIDLLDEDHKTIAKAIVISEKLLTLPVAGFFGIVIALSSLESAIMRVKKFLDGPKARLVLARLAADKGMLEASLWERTGALYSPTDSAILALEQLEEALKEDERLVAEHAPPVLMIISFLYSIGLKVLLTGDVKEAEEILLRTLKISRKLLEAIEDRLLEAILTGLIGNIELALGNAYSYLAEYEKAVEHLKASIEALERFSLSSDDYPSAYASLAEVYLKMHEYEKAEEAYVKATLLMRQRMEHVQESSTSDKFANTLRDFGRLLFLKGVQEARKLLEESVSIREKLDDAGYFEKNPLRLERYAYTLFLLGEMFRYTGEIEHARLIYLKALEIIGRLEATDKRDRTPQAWATKASILHGLAEIERYRGDYNKARKLLKEAIRLVERVKKRIPKARNDNPELRADLAKYYILLADTCLELDEVKEAMKGFKNGIRILKGLQRIKAWDYRPDRKVLLAAAYVSYSRLQHSKGSYNEAYEKYLEAIKILRELSSKRPRTMLIRQDREIELIKAYIGLAELARGLNMRKEYERYIKSAFVLLDGIDPKKLYIEHLGFLLELCSRHARVVPKKIYDKILKAVESLYPSINLPRKYKKYLKEVFPSFQSLVKKFAL